jgi:hypothetical protein
MMLSSCLMIDCCEQATAAGKSLARLPTNLTDAEDLAAAISRTTLLVFDLVAVHQSLG